MADLDIFNKVFGFADDEETDATIRFVPKEESDAEETEDAIWKMDLDSAKYIAEHLGELYNTHFKMYECSECGASYLKDIPHRCDNTIDLNCKRSKIE